MSTYQDFVYSSTPVNKYLVKEFGLVRGAVASKIVYVCNLKDGVCRMGQRRKAEELGIDRSTVSRAENYFIENGYVFVTKQATDEEPYHLKPTKKLLNLIIPPVAENNPPVDVCNPPVAERNQEEESEEETESSLYKENPPKNSKPQKPNKWANAGPVASAVLKIVKIKPSAVVNGTEMDLKNVLRFLQAENITADKVVAFGKWYGQTPSLKAITDSWGLFEEGEQPRHKQFKNGNGAHHGSKPTSQTPAKRSKYSDVI